MCYSRNGSSFFLLNWEYLFHKRHFIDDFKIFLYIFFQNRRSKWPEAFPAFYLGIKKVFCIEPAWVCQYRTASQCAWSKLSPSIEPAYYACVDETLSYDL